MLSPRQILTIQKSLDKTGLDKRAQLLKCLGDPTCLKILSILGKESQLCVSDITDVLGISMPAVSHQLNKLKRMGVVSAKRMGQLICYSFAKTKNAQLAKEVIGKPLD